ncbi:MULTISPECIES: DUF6088 family protein [Burkholderiaceae]|uniref:Transcriptional regulator, AbiEi antitoxin, Type IV TA system n=1 Tax=Burkholderia cepacia TaxID=292 RepID=A0A8I1AS53_BURCE|nr:MULTISPECIES: DUF6088 family protein [Burkholderiaceae]MBB0025229.1 hypothetical protein [Ralstonia pickettii]MBB0036017.1 hypothetical protein [Ralstonia pickettii]MBB0098557.1 hypothetical protein [Ralstonia pickettii]MBB0108384.1 hypothetical protein [Ralstonia pickettii]MBB0129331.1 hypothetical protein [Ralstonia pickettii]
MKTSQAIRERIAAQAVGEPFTPALFAGLGTRAAVDQALMRLVKSGNVERIGHGLYVVPKVSRFGIKALPAPEQIAQTVAGAEGATIEVHGAEAARRFGLTTQVPAQAVFYTTGSSREIRLGKLTIRLQHVAPRKLALAGRPAGLALSALWYLGRHQVTSGTFKRIAEKLPSGEFEVLRGAKASMPAWMVEAFGRYERGELTHA